MVCNIDNKLTEVIDACYSSMVSQQELYLVNETGLPITEVETNHSQAFLCHS
jgi:hypothetical protein